MQQAAADTDLARVDPGADHLDHDVARSRRRSLDLDDVQDVDVSIVIEPDGSGHGGDSFRDPVTYSGRTPVITQLFRGASRALRRCRPSPATRAGREDRPAPR